MMNRSRSTHAFGSHVLNGTRAALALLLLVRISVAVADPCENLQVPAGNKAAVHVYAKGVQIYRWDGKSWVFVAPEAVLFADAEYHDVVGIHYAGPTWQSVSGS